jgi:hypothetical protein
LYVKCLFIHILDTFAIIVLIPSNFPFKKPEIQWKDITIPIYNMKSINDNIFDKWSVSSDIATVSILNPTNNSSMLVNIENN